VDHSGAISDCVAQAGWFRIRSSEKHWRRRSVPRVSRGLQFRPAAPEAGKTQAPHGSFSAIPDIGSVVNGIADPDEQSIAGRRRMLQQQRAGDGLNRNPFGKVHRAATIHLRNKRRKREFVERVVKFQAPAGMLELPGRYFFKEVPIDLESDIGCERASFDRVNEF